MIVTAKPETEAHCPIDHVISQPGWSIPQIRSYTTSKDVAATTKASIAVSRPRDWFRMGPSGTCRPSLYTSSGLVAEPRMESIGRGYAKRAGINRVGLTSASRDMDSKSSVDDNTPLAWHNAPCAAKADDIGPKIPWAMRSRVNGADFHARLSCLLLLQTKNTQALL
jgi:hypothetical protein